ncbi:MAG: DUF1217 domain-containing protein [Pseudomonadota bacterium]
MTTIASASLPGIAGWKHFLKNEEKQLAEFRNDPTVKRDIDKFLKELEGVSSSKELIDNFYTRRFIGAAFSLGQYEDANGLLKKVLEEGTTSETLDGFVYENGERKPRVKQALAVQMNEPSLIAMTTILDFTGGYNPLKNKNTVDHVIERFVRRRFEAQIQASNPELAQAVIYKRMASETQSTAQLAQQRFEEFKTLADTTEKIKAFKAEIATLNESSSVSQKEVLYDIMQDRSNWLIMMRRFGGTATRENHDTFMFNFDKEYQSITTKGETTDGTKLSEQDLIDHFFAKTQNGRDNSARLSVALSYGVPSQRTDSADQVYEQVSEKVLAKKQAQSLIDNETTRTFLTKAYNLQTFAKDPAILHELMTSGVRPSSRNPMPLALMLEDPRAVSFAQTLDFSQGSNPLAEKDAIDLVVNAYTAQTFIDKQAPTRHAQARQDNSELLEAMRTKLSGVRNLDDLLEDDELRSFVARAFDLDDLAGNKDIFAKAMTTIRLDFAGHEEGKPVFTEKGILEQLKQAYIDRETSQTQARIDAFNRQADRIQTIDGLSDDQRTFLAYSLGWSGFAANADLVTRALEARQTFFDPQQTLQDQLAHVIDAYKTQHKVDETDAQVIAARAAAGSVADLSEALNHQDMGAMIAEVTNLIDQKDDPRLLQQIFTAPVPRLGAGQTMAAYAEDLSKGYRAAFTQAQVTARAETLIDKIEKITSTRALIDDDAMRHFTAIATGHESLKDSKYALSQALERKSLPDRNMIFVKLVSRLDFANGNNPFADRRLVDRFAIEYRALREETAKTVRTLTPEKIQEEILAFRRAVPTIKTMEDFLANDDARRVVTETTGVGNYQDDIGTLRSVLRGERDFSGGMNTYALSQALDFSGGKNPLAQASKVQEVLDRYVHRQYVAVGRSSELSEYSKIIAKRSESEVKIIADFREAVKTIESVDQLLSNGQVREFITKAFGLSENWRADDQLLRGLMTGEQEGRDVRTAAMGSQDIRVHAFLNAIDFSQDKNPLKDEATVDGIVDRYIAREFEFELSVVNPGLADALRYKRVTDEHGTLSAPTDRITNWYQVMADQQLDRFVATTLGFPQEVLSTKMEKRLSLYESRVKIDELFNPDNVEKYAERYLAQAAVSASQTGSSQTDIALQLLQGTGFSQDSFATLASQSPIGS